VALIRTDASEDRIASIFRVHECEQVTEQSCKLLYRHRLVEGVCVYESVPIQELTTSLCNLLTLVHPKMEAIRSSETSVLIRATWRHLPEDDNHQVNS
jgi:hypothetical protein